MTDSDEQRARDRGAYFSTDLTWYVVLEGAHPDHDTRALIYRLLETPEWMALYDFGPYRHLAQSGPLLVQLEQPVQWLAWWRQSFPELAGTLCGSNASLEEVGSHLRTLISVRVEGGADALFRFHDSWILSALYSELDETERRKLHGPIERWLWTLGGDLREGILARTDGPTTSPASEDGWLQLDKTKQQAIYQGILARRNWMHETRESNS